MDINHRQDIENLVNSFYIKVRKDESIGFIFEEIARINWDEHLPTMYDFWDSILFGEGYYKGNPMVKHAQLDRLYHLEEKHFNRWLFLWHQTIDELFEGENANQAKLRSEAIAATMRFKIKKLNQGY